MAESHSSSTQSQREDASRPSSPIEKELSVFTQHAPSNEPIGFNGITIRWWQGLAFKRFLAFLALSILPTVVSSVLIITAYNAVLSQYVDPADLERLTSNIQIQLFLVIIFILILSIFTAFIISQTFVRPIKLLGKAVQRISEGDLSVHIRIHRKDELGTLAHFFNGMVDKLKEIQERNREISNIKSQFVSVAAHQLRTPLSAIKWTLRLLLDGDVGKLAPEQQEYLERGYQTNERMINLVNDLLDASRIEEGRFGFHVARTNIHDLVTHAVEDSSLQSEKRNIHIVPRILVDTSRDLMIDADRIRMVINNLIDNAINYSEPGDEVVVTVSENDSEIKISVEDNGIGIPEHEFPKVFSRFYRASNAVRLQTDGSGLGLFIAHNIITHHGGNIWFESKEGEGTTFFVTLPLEGAVKD